MTDRHDFTGRALPFQAARALSAGMALALLAPGVRAAEPTPPTPRGIETPAGPVQRLTLEDAIRVALENNPGLLQAEANRLRAQDRVGEARAATLPQLHASGTYTLQGPVVSFPIQTGSGTQTVQLNRRDVKRAQITATLDTDIAGRQHALQRIARIGVRAADEAVGQSTNDLVSNVQGTYLETLRTQALVRVAQDAVGAAQEQLRVAEAQFRAGVVPQFDVLRASVQVENLRQSQISAQNRERLAEASLIQVLGIEPTSRLELTPLVPPVPTATPLTPPGPGGAAPAPAGAPAAPAAPAPMTTQIPPSLAYDFPRELEPALAVAYARRPELQQVEESIRQARERVKYERRARYPNALITGNYYFTPDSTGFAATKTSWDVTANLTLSIFDFGLTRSRVRGAQHELEALEAQRDQTREAVAREVRTALLNLSEAETRRSTAAANTEQAREALRIARVRYQAGVSTSVEVTDAELALTQAQTNQVNAEYDVLSARAQALRSLGQYATATAAQTPR